MTVYRPCNNPGHLDISPLIVYDHLHPTSFGSPLYLASLSHLNRECPSLLSSGDDSPHDNVDGDPSYDDNGTVLTTIHHLMTWMAIPHTNLIWVTPQSNYNGQLTRKLPRQNARGGKPNRTKGASSPKLEKYDWDSFHVVDFLAPGRSGTVFEAIFRGERVALKLCDLW